MEDWTAILKVLLKLSCRFRTLTLAYSAVQAVGPKPPQNASSRPVVQYRTKELVLRSVCKKERSALISRGYTFTKTTRQRSKRRGGLFDSGPIIYKAMEDLRKSGLTSNDNIKEGPLQQTPMEMLKK